MIDQSPGVTETVSWSWSFPGGIYGWLISAFLLLFLVWFAYRSTLRRLAALPRWGFIFLRSLVFLFLLFCLANPVKIITHSITKERHQPVAVLVDTSGSMVRLDPGHHTRLETATAAVHRIWDDSGRMKIFGFSDKLIPLTNPDQLGQSNDPEKETHLLGSMKELLQSAPAEGWGRVVVLTDGNDTTESALDETGHLFRERGVPLLLAVTQNDLHQPDVVRLADATLPASVRLNTQYPLDVLVSSQATTPGEMTLRVLQNSQTVAEAPLKIAPGALTQRKRFLFKGSAVGSVEYEVQLIDPNQTEPVDHFYVSTEIVDKEKVRVLFYAGALSPEYRFIRKALETNPSFEVTGLLHLNASSLLRQFHLNGQTAIADPGQSFPEDLDAINQFDVIVLDDLLPSQLDPAQVKVLLDYVKGGGGVLFLTSTSVVASAFSGSELEQLLPVVFEPVKPTDQPSLAPRSLSLAERLAALNVGRAQDPTDEAINQRMRGKVQPLVTMDYTSDGQSVLGSLGDSQQEAAPMFREYAAVQRAKPGAVIVARHPSDRNEWGLRTLLAMQHFGAGKSAVLATDSVWRWALSLPADSTAYGRLWQQMLLWVNNPARGTPEILVTSHLYLVNDKISIQVRPPGGIEGGSLAGIKLVARHPDHTSEEIPLSSGGAGGTLGAILTAPIGPWLRLEASAYGGNPTVTLLNIREKKLNVEEEHLSVDWGLLRRLTAAADGQLVEADKLDQLPPLTTESDRIVEKKQIDLWHNKWVFVLLLGLFGIELILRRQQKLL